MTEINFGIKHVHDGIEPLPIVGAEMSVIGIIGTAPQAVALAFPLNAAVYLTTDNIELVQKLGPTGTLPDAVRGIVDNLGDDERAARLVIVRVAEGNNEDATIANVIGSSSAKSGIYAFLDAPNLLAVTPRLIIAPGFTHQAEAGVVGHGAITPGSGGTDGEYPLVLTGGVGVPATGTFTVIDGELFDITIASPGSYTTAPSAFSFAASTGLTGAAASVTTGVGGNAVCAALPSVLGALRAHAIVDGDTSSRQNYINWLETMLARRLIPGPACGVKVLNSAGQVETRPASPRIAGIAVRVDGESDGRPFRSWANRPVYGIVGVSRNINFSLDDATTEGQELIGLGGSIIVRGEANVESAIADGGFIFIGTDTRSDDDQWRFYHVSRGRDYIELSQMRALRAYLGRYNITLAVIQAILNSVGEGLSLAKTNGDILDYRLGFERDRNTPGELRQGNLWIMFKAEEPPVLRKLTISSRRHRKALENLVATVSAQIESIAG